MKAYGYHGKPKYKATKSDHVPGTSKGVSKRDKLIIKNANRSMKKKMRRMLNREEEQC